MCVIVVPYRGLSGPQTYWVNAPRLVKVVARCDGGVFARAWIATFRKLVLTWRYTTTLRSPMWPQLTAEYRAVTYSIYSCEEAHCSSACSTLYRVPRASLGALAPAARARCFEV